MAMPTTPEDRKHQAFVLAEDGSVALRVHAPPIDFGSIGNLGKDVDDAVTILNDLGHNTAGLTLNKIGIFS